MKELRGCINKAIYRPQIGTSHESLNLISHSRKECSFSNNLANVSHESKYQKCACTTIIYTYRADKVVQSCGVHFETIAGRRKMVQKHWFLQVFFYPYFPTLVTLVFAVSDDRKHPPSKWNLKEVRDLLEETPTTEQNDIQNYWDREWHHLSCRKMAPVAPAVAPPPPSSQ